MEEKSQEGSLAVVKRSIGKKGNGKNPASQKPTPELPSPYTNTTGNKFISMPVPPIAKLLPSMEVNIVYADAAI